MAPMVGLTHAAMRDLVQVFTPIEIKTLWPTEMLNSRRLPSQILGETKETKKTKFELRGEAFLMPQILGNEEVFIKNSIQKLSDWGAVGIDLNMGCPVKKALKHNYGVSLMGDPGYAREVVMMAKNGSNVPISVKTRAGENKEIGELLKFIRPLIDGGTDWITLHPRGPREKRKGNAEWKLVEQLRKEIDIPVIGNGDIQNSNLAVEAWEKFQPDGVMIGRGLTSRPWMLWQIGKKLNLPISKPEMARELGINEPPFTPAEEAQMYGAALKYFVNKCFEYFDDQDALKKIKFFIINSHPWLNYGNRLVSIISSTKDPVQLVTRITKFFESSGLRLSDTTNLRY